MADTCKILLVENAAYLITFLSKILERKFEIVNVPTIQEAQAQLKKQKFDVVLMDNHTAEPGFYRPLEELMSIIPGIAVVIMATKRDQSSAEKVLQKTGRLFFADKPAQQNQLIYICKKAAAHSEEMVRKASKMPAAASEKSSGLSSKDLDMILSVDSDAKSVKSSLEFPKSVLLIEDDEFVVKMVSAALREIGVRTVDAFNDGEKGWKAATQNNYDFIILDWMVQTVSGLTLFNRFRHHEVYRLTPILVISGFIGKKDFSVLGDFYLSEIFEKPFQSATLGKKVGLLYKEAHWFNSQEEKLYDFFDKLQSKQIVDPQAIIKYISGSPKPFPLAIAAGRILRLNGIYDGAEILFKYALKSKETSLMALNELGKLYLLTNKNREAKNVLKKAMALSPDNIERLCDLGNISLKEMDTDSANAYFSRALKIDKKRSTRYRRC